jgi:WD40 repeat protein
VTGGDDSVSKVWRVSDITSDVRREVAVTDAHSSGVASVSVDQQRRYVSGTKDHVVAMWSLGEGKFEKLLLRSISLVSDVAFRPDGTFVAVACEDGSLTSVNVADPSGMIETHTETQSLSYHVELISPDSPF